MLALLAAIPMATPGSLLIMGGGRESPEAAKRLIALAGGSDAAIVILAHSREEVARSASALKEFFEANGARRVEAPTSEDPTTIVGLLRTAKGVFLSGGDQNRFLARFPASSGVAAALKGVVARGGVVGGTSAGASLLGEWMPTGSEMAETALKPHPEGLTAGLGLLPKGIIDQHFLQRNRLKRLTGFVLQQPGSFGIGIDERAWVIVRNGQIEVGEGQAVLYSQAKRRVKDGALGGTLTMNVMNAGERVKQP